MNTDLEILGSILSRLDLEILLCKLLCVITNIEMYAGFKFIHLYNFCYILLSIKSNFKQNLKNIDCLKIK